MEYEVGIRLNNIEQKLDFLIEKLLEAEKKLKKESEE